MDLVRTVFTDFFTHTQPLFGAIGIFLLFFILSFNATVVRFIFRSAYKEKQYALRRYVTTFTLLFVITLLYIIIDTHVISLPDPVVFYGFYILAFTILFGIRPALLPSVLVIILVEYYVYEPHTVSLFRHPISMIYMVFAIIIALLLGQIIRLNQQKLMKKNEDLDLLIKARDQFTAVAAHELKTPLTTISLYSQVLNKQYKNEKASKVLQNSVQTITRETDKLTYMINDLLDFSRFQNKKFKLNRENLNLMQLCRERVHVVQSLYPDHRYIFRPKTGSATMYADRLALDRVLTNLLTNAGKYSHPKSTVEVALKKNPKEFIISVKDKGIGIDKNYLVHLFEPFYQVENGKKGLGLGLHIAQSIVKMHGGSIWVESTLGKGSTFFVSLPIQPIG